MPLAIAGLLESISRIFDDNRNFYPFYGRDDELAPGIFASTCQHFPQLLLKNPESILSILSDLNGVLFAYITNLDDPTLYDPTLHISRLELIVGHLISNLEDSKYKILNVIYLVVLTTSCFWFK